MNARLCHRLNVDFAKVHHVGIGWRGETDADAINYSLAAAIDPDVLDDVIGGSYWFGPLGSININSGHRMFTRDHSESEMTDEAITGIELEHRFSPHAVPFQRGRFS